MVCCAGLLMLSCLGESHGHAQRASAGGPALPGIPSGGTVLFQERFDDGAFASRGWYDGPDGAITRAERVPGSDGAFECAFAVGAMSCAGGKPSRRQFPASDTVYASFWLKFSANWAGSGRAYHPHMFHFINDLDDDRVGPARTHLTTYIEVVNGRAVLALQDAKNVDTTCVLRNNDTAVGCGGPFGGYPFTEARSVAACNGLVGEVQGRDCFPTAGGGWYSSRSWSSPDAFVDAAGPNDKADWHFVEVYFAMNSVRNGVGIPDGKIRWVQDGRTLIASDRILLRTNQHANLRFDQFAMLPYIGPGSPVAQSFWVDELTVATAKP
jgi:hypothetical protein